VSGLLVLAILAPVTRADESAVIKAGQPVRLVCDDVKLGIFTGKIGGVGRSGFTVRTDVGLDSLVQVPYYSISKMEVCFGRRGHATVGLAIGLMAGFVYGLVLGKEVNGTESDGWFKHKGFLPALLSGATAGGVIGAIIRTDDWRRVDPKSIRMAAGPARHGLGVTLAYHF
jgi:hypothetical protein